MTPIHSAFETDLKAFLDGELTLWRRFQVCRHLKNCPQCREEIRLMQTLETELKTEEAATMSADLRARILQSAPVETPKLAPKSPRRLTPNLVFGLGSLAVLGVLMFGPSPGCGGGGGGFYDRAAAPTSQELAPQSYAKRAADSDSVSATAPTAGALSSAESASARRRQGGSMWKNDFTSPDLRGAENKANFNGVVPDQRQVHKQGSISIAVDDAEAKSSAVEISVKNVGGFIAQNALSTGEGGRKTATLDVRVPVAEFESIVAKIGKLGVVREKSVNGEDITQRVTVAGAQRQSLSRELSIREAQLRALSPKKVAERQNIVADVRNLRFQANQARAQLEYLKKYASLATLFVTLQDKAKPAPVASTTGELGQTARAAWSSFLLSARLPLQLLIWIAAYAPLWVPALLIWRKFGRKLFGAVS